MYRRLALEKLEDTLRAFPVAALVGSRQTGKTTLAKEIVRRRSGNALYLDLELPGDLAKLADAQTFLSRHADRLVVLDEIQHTPEIFPLLRALVDRGRRPGRFLVLGSASSDLLRQASESLAGRIRTVELPGLLLAEVAPGAGRAANAWRRLWVRGGYPGSFDAPSEGRSSEWREAFLRTFLERDIREFGVRIAATQLRRFWTMLAHVHGQTWNASLFAENFAVSPPTVRAYLDLLTGLFVVRQLPPLAANVSKRLIKAPKTYVRDSGMLHALLGIADEDDLLSRPALGASFEGFAIEQILGLAPRRADAAFYRTHTGVELDLVLTMGKRRFGIEIKYTSAPTLSNGTRVALEDAECGEGWIVTAGEDRFPLAKDVEAVPLPHFLREVIAPLRR
ncbi:MAG: ATP-binding protein [Planctomycetes bacterium]|nr:ATP-binding protein [Planctomycetota bacterium]